MSMSSPVLSTGLQNNKDLIIYKLHYLRFIFLPSCFTTGLGSLTDGNNFVTPNITSQLSFLSYNEVVGQINT